MRGEPHPAVLSWVAAQPRSLLYASYVSQAEILYGIAALPEGRRRTALMAAAEAMFTEDFAGRVLPSYATPTKIGDVIEGRVVGQVMRSRHPGFREGDFASGGYGWQTHSVVHGDALIELVPRRHHFQRCLASSACRALRRM